MFIQKEKKEDEDQIEMEMAFSVWKTLKAISKLEHVITGPARPSSEGLLCHI
jgi:hypothetical protein